MIKIDKVRRPAFDAEMANHDTVVTTDEDNWWNYEIYCDQDNNQIGYIARSKVKGFRTEFWLQFEPADKPDPFIKNETLVV